MNRELEPRSFHAACAVGSKLMIVGGRGLKDQHFADVHLFDIGEYCILHTLEDRFLSCLKQQVR